jgi:hypothetical protein
MGFGKQKGTTSSQTSSSYGENYGSDVWGGQAPFLQDLYSRAQGMAGQGYQGAAGLQQAQQALQGLIQPAGGTDPTLAAYGRQLGQQFQEQILPGIRGEGISAGGLGSSRYGLAQGQAAQGAQRNLQDFGAQTYGQRMDRQLGAGQALGQLSELQGQAPWQGLQQYAGLLGPALSLNRGGYQTSTGTGTSRGGGGFNFKLW